MLLGVDDSLLAADSQGCLPYMCGLTAAQQTDAHTLGSRPCMTAGSSVNTGMSAALSAMTQGNTLQQTAPSPWMPQDQTWLLRETTKF